VITSFADKESEKVFAGQFSRKLPRSIQSGALQKMIILNLTDDIMTLWTMPGLRPEKLSGKRKGQWSIRINNQWRICFQWTEKPPQASSVEICDYH
jgi:proteic killer suppression protein